MNKVKNIVNASWDEDRAYFVFGEFIDPNEYAGIEFNRSGVLEMTGGRPAR